MPKVKWLQPKPKVKYLAALLRAYIKAAGLTSTDIGEKLNCTPEAVRAQISKPAEQWRLSSLMAYCTAIGVPPAEALNAAMMEAAQE